MKKAITYLFGTLILVVAANFFYELSGLYNEDVEKCGGQMVFTIDALKNEREILYLTESSNIASSPADSSKEFISDIFNRISGRNVGAVNLPASHAGTYNKLVRRLKNSKTRCVIISLNLRSFGINWIESNLETNLSKANVIYMNTFPLVKKMMLAFKVYDNKEQFQRDRIIKWHYKRDVLFTRPGKFRNVRDWDSYMFSSGHINERGERDEAKCALACHFIKNYAFVIDEQNPRIKDFDLIVDFCKKNNIKVVLNLLPENFEKAQELVGNDLTMLMRENANFLIKRYSPRATVVDNVTLLSDSHFIDHEWPTEHYNYEGRKKVAIKLKEAFEN